MKLVKNVKVLKLPRAKDPVLGALRRAVLDANRLGWTEVVIVGGGLTPSSNGLICSNLGENEAIGILEKGKLMAIFGEPLEE